MAAVARRDLEALVSAAGDWHSAQSPAELATAALPALHALVPCDGVGWNEIDIVSGALSARVAPIDYDVGPLDAFERVAQQHPLIREFNRRGDPGAVKFSDFLSAREFHGLGIYTDFYRPLGVEDQLAILLDANLGRMVTIAFNRGRRSFSERDRTVAELARAHLATAYRNLGLRLEALARADALERGLEGRLVVTLNAHGRVADCGPRARALLAHWFGDVPPTLSSGVLRDSDAELHIRAVGGDPPLVVLDERRYRPDPERVRELGLTPREAQIVALAGRGGTDAQIAAELFLSPRTVSKHLENAYAKLGVRSRGEAAARLLGAG